MLGTTKLKTAIILIFLSVSGCKLGDHNKGIYLTIDGSVVDTNGVPISGVDVEFPFTSQCCSRSEIANGVCKFTTGVDGKWSVFAQVCAEDNCSCSFTAKKSGFQDKTESFSYSGTNDSTISINVILQ